MHSIRALEGFDKGLGFYKGSISGFRVLGLSVL